jgi:hypothetical protein
VWSTCIRVLVAALAAYAAVPALWALLLRTWRQQVGGPPWYAPREPWALLCGLAAGIALLGWQRPNRFLRTFLHEACHALVCVLLFVPVHGFRATRTHGGEVVHARVDPFRDALIAIAPYTLPILLLPVLIIRIWVSAQPERFLLTAASVLVTMQHVAALPVAVATNWRPATGDLARVGRPLSVVLILLALLALADVLIRAWWG